MKQNSLSILLTSFVISLTASFVACQSDTDDVFMGKVGDPVIFGATISDINAVRTRAEEPESGNGLDSSYIASEPYDMDFFIQLCCQKANGELYTEIGTYQIPSGYEGRLEPKAETMPLQWQDLISDHTFYAWNMPWDEDYEPTNGEGKLKNIEVVFHNSSEANGYADHKNDSILEYFVAAKSQAYNYKGHGKYVDLTFRHLVSKIKIGSFVLIEPGGAIQKNLKADITFIGMPTKATFYPHPEDGRLPYIGAPVKSRDDGVTYFIDHEATYKDVFYVCPEIDFSEMNFKVQLNSVAYKDYATYYGTFDDVKFEREPGYAYDDSNSRDAKVLHAGEMMTLNITLIPGVGPGLSIIIDKWNTEEATETSYHTYPGIYSDAEVKELNDFFANQKDYNPDNVPEIERLFEMYGEERDIDGDGENEKVFPLYDNVDISQSASGNIFPIPPGYVLDGMGHTITMKINTGSVFGSGHRYFNVGTVIDVWLTDGNGHTIYIDKEGYIWIYDQDVEGFKKAEDPDHPGEYYHLEPLVDPYKSYDISCETGRVHRSTYYNNNVVGS